MRRVREGEGGHFESPERGGGGGRGRSQRDFSCPGQKKKSGPGSPRPAASLSHLTSPLPSLTLSRSPAFLTQLPAVTDGDMCHIVSTCVRRAGGWGGGPIGGLS